MADVFMSYKSEDRELVEPLAHALEQAGVSVWWDKKISAGGSWRETIAGALNSAKVVIVAWSKRTEDSSDAAWVFNEVDEAQRMKLPIIPVQLEPCTIPLGFRHVQAANLAGWKGEADNSEWQEVLDAVRAATAGKPIGAAVRRAPAAAKPAPAPEKPRGNAAGPIMALAAVLLLAGGGFFAWKTGLVGAAPTATAVVAPTSVTITEQTVPAPPAPALTEAQIRDQVAKEYAAQQAQTQAQTQAEIAAREQAAREQGAQSVRDAAAKEQALKDAAAKELAARQLAAAASAPLQIVYFSREAGAGSYRREGGYWNEYRADGQLAFTFRQRTETQNRLELYDDKRDMTIVIDLNQKRIFWSQKGGPQNFIYPITTWKR